MTYSEKLREPRWQRKRLEIMERDNFACLHCGSTGKTLNVHHRLYERGRDPWEYQDSNFMTLCEECHERVTVLIKRATLAASDLELGRDLYNLLRHNINGHDEAVSAFLSNYSPDGTYSAHEVEANNEIPPHLRPVEREEGMRRFEALKAMLD